MAPTPHFLISAPASPPSSPVFQIAYNDFLIAATSFFVASAIGIAKWLVGREVSRLDETLSTLQRDLADLRKVQSVCVLRDDYVAQDAILNSKIDALHRRLDQLMALMIKGGQ